MIFLSDLDKYIILYMPVGLYTYSTLKQIHYERQHQYNTGSVEYVYKPMQI